MTKLPDMVKRIYMRLMDDPGIIRNRLKINAAIENARAIQKIRSESGSFSNWLDKNSKTITFTGRMDKII